MQIKIHVSKTRNKNPTKTEIWRIWNRPEECPIKTMIMIKWILFYMKIILSTLVLSFFNVYGLEYIKGNILCVFFKGNTLKKVVNVTKWPNRTKVTRVLVFVKNLVKLLDLSIHWFLRFFLVGLLANSVIQQTCLGWLLHSEY